MLEELKKKLESGSLQSFITGQVYQGIPAVRYERDEKFGTYNFFVRIPFQQITDKNSLSGIRNEVRDSDIMVCMCGRPHRKYVELSVISARDHRFIDIMDNLAGRVRNCVSTVSLEKDIRDIKAESKVKKFAKNAGRKNNQWKKQMTNAAMRTSLVS